MATCARHDTEACFDCVYVGVWHLCGEHDALCEINQVVPDYRRGQHDGCDKISVVGISLLCISQRRMGTYLREIPMLY